MTTAGWYFTQSFINLYVSALPCVSTVRPFFSLLFSALLYLWFKLNANVNMFWVTHVCVWVYICVLINQRMSVYCFPLYKQTNLVPSVKVQRVNIPVSCVYSMDRGEAVGVCVCLGWQGVSVGGGAITVWWHVNRQCKMWWVPTKVTFALH